MIDLPKIEIAFKQKVETFIKRSERGTSAILIKDVTKSGAEHVTYTDISDLRADKSKYTNENFLSLMDVMELGVARLDVIRVGADQDNGVTKALDLLARKVNTAWIGMVSETDEDYAEMIAWIKAKALEGRTFKAIVPGDGIDHDNLCELDEQEVTFADARGKKDVKYFIPSLVGIASICNIERSITNYVCTKLVEVSEVANVKTSLNKGKLILINSYGVVKVGLGINSLTSFDAENGKFEDMRYIDIKEAVDMINDDVSDVFRNHYSGSSKNLPDEQIMFISEVNTYFAGLEEIKVLNPNYDNVAELDLDSQRKAWINVKSEAKTWDDTKVKNTPFKRTIFVMGDIFVVGAMDNLKMNLNVN